MIRAFGAALPVRGRAAAGSVAPRVVVRPFGAALLALAAACANPEAPPGGPEDRVPPVVIETVPDTFAVVEPGLREFFFRFNERISERPSAGQLDAAVVISPPLGAARVRHGRDGISIEAQEGLAPGRLYRVTVLPVINDMFSNTLRDPFDLVISTGGEFVPNVVAGMVEDRITGQGVPDARVEARFNGEGDTLTHWNLTGSDGVFSMRFVPGEPFQLVAWEDRDRDGAVGEFEPQSALSAGAFEGSPDTTFTILTLVEPDTTPARLARVEVQDSVTLSFEFDDYLEPGMPGVVFTGRLVLARLADTAEVAVEGEAAGGAVEGVAGDSAAAAAAGDSAAAAADTLDAAPGDSVQVEFADTVTVPPGKDTIVVRFFHAHEYERRNREVADSLARAAQAEEQARIDSLARLGEAPPARAEATEEEQQLDTAEAPLGPVGLSGEYLPAQTLTGVLDEALVRGAPYEASVSGVVNIGGLPGGGGAAVVLWELPPPDTTTADSAAVAEDSVGVDTLQAGPDTLRVGPDTLPVGPDTLQAGPDTTRVGPDTTRVGPDTLPVDTLRVGPDTTRAGPDTTRVGPDTTRARPRLGAARRLPALRGRGAEPG